MTHRPVAILVIASLACVVAGAVAPVRAAETRMMTWCDRGDRDPLECVSSLRDRFAVRGPATFVQFGTQLSKSLVSQPEAFFQAMADDPLTFTDWKNSLHEHTFRMAAEPGTIEYELQSVYLARLRDMMRDTALQNSGGTPWAGMAQDVLAALDDVHVASTATDAGP